MSGEMTERGVDGPEVHPGAAPVNAIVMWTECDVDGADGNRG